MYEEQSNILPDQVMYHHLRERYTLMNVVTLRKSIHSPSWKNDDENQAIKKEVKEIIFQSTKFINQLKP